MTRVDVAGTLVPVLEPDAEAAVEDCPEVRDTLESRIVTMVRGCRRRTTVVQCEGLLRLWKGGID